MPAPKTRLYVDTLLQRGIDLDLDEARTNYLRNVLRLGAEAEIALFNAAHGEWRARIRRIDKRAASLRIENRLREGEDHQTTAGPWLLFAPIKRAPIDLLVEKATELGVARLVPVFTRRTVAERVNLGRLRMHAIEAAEQCGRLSVPEIAEPVKLFDLLGAWQGESQTSMRRILACAEAGDAKPFAVVAAERRAAPTAILTGPEGGFEGVELDAFKDLPFITSVGLGPRILRADTAALAALAIYQAIAGDGASRPGDGVWSTSR
ncbi:MAG: 16S rRNA (uracil(1498)-N(3))-methyltransferase [Alphaproteobacteria bacterium]